MTVRPDDLALGKDIILAMKNDLMYWIGDGTPFFDRMDALLSSDYFYEFQVERFYGSKYDRAQVIVSGKWGRGFKHWAAKNAGWMYPLWLPGGLRHEELHNYDRHDMLFAPNNYKNKNFVFLDNSCYKGRTRDKIKEKIEYSGGKLLETLVLYDGSIRPIEGIKGIFRYHD